MAAMNLKFNYKFIYGNVDQQHQNILMHKWSLNSFRNNQIMMKYKNKKCLRQSAKLRPFPPSFAEG